MSIVKKGGLIFCFLLVSILNSSLGVIGLRQFQNEFNRLLAFFLLLCILFYINIRWLKKYGKPQSKLLLKLTAKDSLLLVRFFFIWIILQIVFHPFFAVTDPQTMRSILSLLQEGQLMQRFLIILSVCFTQPFLEEIIFRGIILEQLKSIHILLAIVISALLFAFIHDFSFFNSHLISGLLFGTIYASRSKLSLSVLLHCMTNCSVLIYYFIQIYFSYR